MGVAIGVGRTGEDLAEQTAKSTDDTADDERDSQVGGRPSSNIRGARDDRSELQRADRSKNRHVVSHRRLQTTGQEDQGDCRNCPADQLRVVHDSRLEFVEVLDDHEGGECGQQAGGQTVCSGDAPLLLMLDPVLALANLHEAEAVRLLEHAGATEHETNNDRQHDDGQCHGIGCANNFVAIVERRIASLEGRQNPCEEVIHQVTEDAEDAADH